MISVERARVLLGNPDIPDEEVEKIRDSFRSLVEVIFEHWQADRDKQIQKDENEKTKANTDTQAN